MKTIDHRRSALRPLVWVAAALAIFGCKDDSPCDEGFVERGPAACYPLPVGAAGEAGSSGQAGTTGDDFDAGDGGGAAPAAFYIGQPCADTVSHSDCGGGAPICADLPAGTMCTQILCQAGEPNQGVCPSDWMCLSSAGNPSACVKF
jgi:hypothetical protein